jgi:hypothetical protein
VPPEPPNLVEGFEAPSDLHTLSCSLTVGSVEYFERGLASLAGGVARHSAIVEGVEEIVTFGRAISREKEIMDFLRARYPSRLDLAVCRQEEAAERFTVSYRRVIKQRTYNRVAVAAEAARDPG